MSEIPGTPRGNYRFPAAVSEELAEQEQVAALIEEARELAGRCAHSYVIERLVAALATRVDNEATADGLRANLEALADELEADALQVAGMLDQETKRGRIPNVAMVEAYNADAVAKRGAARKLRELLPAPRSSSLIGPAPTTENEAGR